MNETEPNEASPLEATQDEDALHRQLADAEARAAENWERYLRATADMENARRRNERDKTEFQKFALERILGDLLTVADSLDLGTKAGEAAGAELQNVLEGLRLTHKQVLSLLDKYGVKREEPQGQPFDPDRHEAVSMAESTAVAPNHVLAVMQTGYLLHDRVLRPARVIVARAPTQDLNEAPASPDSPQG